MSGMFKPGEIEQIKELRAKTGLGLREAYDLFQKHGSVETCITAIGGQAGFAAYVSPENRVRNLLNEFYQALSEGKVDEISARVKLSSCIEEIMGMSYKSWLLRPPQ